MAQARTAGSAEFGGTERRRVGWRGIRGSVSPEIGAFVRPVTDPGASPAQEVVDLPDREAKAAGDLGSRHAVDEPPEEGQVGVAIEPSEASLEIDGGFRRIARRAGAATAGEGETARVGLTTLFPDEMTSAASTCYGAEPGQGMFRPASRTSGAPHVEVHRIRDRFDIDTAQTDLAQCALHRRSRALHDFIDGVRVTTREPRPSAAQWIAFHRSELP